MKTGNEMKMLFSVHNMNFTLLNKIEIFIKLFYMGNFVGGNDNVLGNFEFYFIDNFEIT